LPSPIVAPLRKLRCRYFVHLSGKGRAKSFASGHEVNHIGNNNPRSKVVGVRKLQIPIAKQKSPAT
jgi:hypothetical protein